MTPGRSARWLMGHFLFKIKIHSFIQSRCHRKHALGEISFPGGSGPRVFSPPGGYARSCFQDGSSAPRTNAPGMRYRWRPLRANYVPAIQQQSERNHCGILVIVFALHSLLGSVLEEERACLISNKAKVRFSILALSIQRG